MAVQACIKPKMFDDGDDGSAIFKRNRTVSKQNKSNSEIKNSLSRRHEGSSGRQVSNVHGENSSPKRCKVDSLTKASTVKVSPTSSTASTLCADNSKKSSKQNSVRPEKKELNESHVETHVKTEDSEDDQPLSARFCAGLSKSNSNHVLNGLSSPTPSLSHSPKAKVSTKNSSDDSEDDIPLALKLRLKANVGASSSKLPKSERLSSPAPSSSQPQKTKVSTMDFSDDSEDEIPLSLKFQLKATAMTSSSKSIGFDEKKPKVSKLQLNGISKNANQLIKSPKGMNKRPLDEGDIAHHSSVKKPKLSDASVNGKVKQVSVKAETDNNDDYTPLSKCAKKSVPSNNKSASLKKKITNVASSFKKTTKKSKKFAKSLKYSKSTKLPPTCGEGQKWTTLVHNGIIFPPPYKPNGVKMLYNGHPVDLTPEQEVATMFAVMKDTEYATKPRFIENFINDWRAILGKKHEKKALKEEKLKQEEKYMWAIVDGVKEKVGNFRVEPPGLFRGRGEHPKMGKLKRRIHPSDITINIGKEAPIPECPIPGERWKEVKHDNTVTWLAYWNDPINPKEFKYAFLAASSSLKGKSDKEKYEKARLLKDYIDNIRATYTKDFKIKDVMKRQIAVATYLIDKLALRAGNEKDDDEADTVGCCTLKVENVKLVPPNKLEFDFLGKDSIKYFNVVEVELPVYKAIGQFQTGKLDRDDLFDKLDTSKLNAYLKELMSGLTAKVFRTYNASITLDEMLNRETKDGDVVEKIVAYQHANKEGVLDGLKTDLTRAKKGKPPLKDSDGKPKKNMALEVLERKISLTNAKIERMERDMKTKEDLKTVALGTSKINYCDPRISVAWCKRHEVPIEKIFNKSLLAKFAWAMDVDPCFRF